MVFGFFCEGISGEENNVKEGKGLLKILRFKSYYQNNIRYSNATYLTELSERRIWDYKIKYTYHQYFF